jgi:hypothetical protein
VSSAVEVFTVTRRRAKSEWRVRIPPTAPRAGSLIRYGDGLDCKSGALRSSPSSILGRPTNSASPTGDGRFENRIAHVMKKASARVFASASFGCARESRIDSESIARRFDSFRPNRLRHDVAPTVRSSGERFRLQIGHGAARFRGGPPIFPISSMSRSANGEAR